MPEQDFTNREIQMMHTSLTNQIGAVKLLAESTFEQAKKTNGRVNKLERNMLVVACVIGTAAVMKFPEILQVIQLLI